MKRILQNHVYHIIEIDINVKPSKEIKGFLQERFGDGKDGRWFFIPPRIFFKNQTDHMMFLLRWSDGNNRDS